MSEFTFKENDPIYFTPKNSGKTAIAFTVASVNEEGQATQVKLAQGAPSASEALNLAIKTTGATSGTLSKHDANSIDLSHGRKATSPYYTEERNFG